jgi:uncharacterized protein
LTEELIITQTINWIKSVVVGCNFCPFAARVLQNKSIHYAVVSEGSTTENLELVLKELQRLDQHPEIETSFIIFPNHFEHFGSYLNFFGKAEKNLSRKHYDGVYQIASFHPEYCFAGAQENDAANYTNRSVYPMLHLLREDSITRALANYPSPDNIPQRNINYAQSKGLAYMQLLREACIGQ